MATVQELEGLLRQRRSTYDRRVGELQGIGRTRGDTITKLDQQSQLEASLERVSVFLTTFAEEAQDELQRKIEGLVTHALQTIFGEEMVFKMEQSTKRNQANVDFFIESQMGAQLVRTPVLDARGGGVAAVVGFILRLVLLVLTPGARRVLVLDETFAQVSDGYEPRVAEFLREVADKAHVQIIMVTHSAAYTDIADQVYRFRLVDGVTEVTKWE